MSGWGNADLVQQSAHIRAFEDSEQSYRSLVELSPDALIVHNGNDIILANQATLRLIDARSLDDILGRSVLGFIAPASRPLVLERIQRLHNGSAVPLVDETWIRLDGSEVQVEVAATPMPWLYPRAAMVMARDVTERRRLEAERETLLAEKELLMQEVHHRVANSLQLVQGLLNLQARGAGSDDVRIQLREASARIGTTGILHSRLQRDSSAVEGEVKAYLEGVMADLRISLGETYSRPLILESAEASPLTLKADLLVALGLITAEAVTNSIKHGQGPIRVCLNRRNAGLELAIEDEGPGFPEGFDPLLGGKGLGMRMIASLIQARGGRIAVGPDGKDASVPPSRIAAFLPL